MITLTQEEYRLLQERVHKGKKWIASLHEKGQYNNPKYKNHIALWMEMSGHLLSYDVSHGNIPMMNEEHSPMWLKMQEIEKEKVAKREAAKLKRQLKKQAN